MSWRRGTSTLVLLASLLLLCVRAQAADRQIRPFAGATFGGVTTFVDPELAVGKPTPAIGMSAVFLGEVLGAEVEVADAPGLFESGDKHLVLRSRVTTISGNVIVAAPHRLTEYWLRPYLVAGGGLMRISRTTSLSVSDISKVFPEVDVGGGVVAFLTNRVGVSWEVRRFQSIGSHISNEGLSVAESGEEQLSFWRATMAVVFRY
jgi:hypothetical protein